MILAGSGQDIRTAPWHYAAREIVTMLEEREYTWFELSEKGELMEMTTRSEFDANMSRYPTNAKKPYAAKSNMVFVREYYSQPCTGPVASCENWLSIIKKDWDEGVRIVRGRAPRTTYPRHCADTEYGYLRL